MRRVLKYVFQHDEFNADFRMPNGADVVAFQVQRGLLCIWCIADTDHADEVRSFALCGTGHAAPNGKYIGTVQFHEGNFVLHAFEITKQQTIKMEGT